MVSFVCQSIFMYTTKSTFTVRFSNSMLHAYTCTFYIINSFPDDINLPLSKLKAFGDDKFNVAKMIQFLCERVENVVGKGENAGYQHFPRFSQCFQNLSISQS